MLLRREIGSLINGVSQQPPVVRSPSQAQAQVNGWSSVVDGVGDRMPTQHVAKLSDATSNALIHHINRDVTQRYIVVVTNGDLKVYDLNGNEKTVSFPDGKGYLSASNPTKSFSLVTVADYTFLVNKTKVVGMKAVGDDQDPQPGYLYWLARSREDADLTTALQSQYPPNPAAVVGDLKGTKQTFADLPDAPTNGDIYRINGSAESGFASFYVVRDGGVWDETVAPGHKNLLNWETMPHALVHNGDGTFTFSPFSWAPRRVGDTNTNPNPSFVSRTISDVFFYKNRLGFLVGENVVFSRAGDFGNFYRMTTTDVLDDDTVDVAATETNVTNLNYAVTFDVGFMLFSDQTQFSLNVKDILTPSTVSLDAVTEYRTLPKVRPAKVGQDVLYVSAPGSYALVHDYYVSPDNASLNVSDNITEHVPKYIPSDVASLFGTTDYDALFVIAKTGEVYVFQSHYTQKNEQIQAAWHKWTFGPEDSVLNGTIIDQWFYLVVQRPSGLFLEKLNLETTATSADLEFDILLDRRVDIDGTYLSVSDSTEFQLPYTVSDAEKPLFNIVRAGSGHGSVDGALIDPTLYEWIADDLIRVPGNFAADSCSIGRTYTFLYTFSRQYLRDNNGDAITTGRLQLRTFTLNYVESAYFETLVAPYGQDASVEGVVADKLSDFTGKTLGSDFFKTNTPTLDTGSYTFTVYGNAADAIVSVQNPTYVRAKFQSAEWEGFYASTASPV